MKFSDLLFREENEAEESIKKELAKSAPSIYYVNNSGKKFWVGYDLKDYARIIIDADVIKNRKQLYINNVSSYHPDVRPALRELVAIFPDVETYQTRFDGPPGATVAELLGEKEDEDWGWIQWFYHGTSSGYLDRIQKEGLKPRSETGTSPGYGAPVNAQPGEDTYVYISQNDGNAVRFAARHANQVYLQANPGADTYPIILRIDGRKLNPGRFRPDHDAKTHSWEESLSTLGSIGYEGTIRPDAITVHLVVDRNAESGWRKPS